MSEHDTNPMKAKDVDKITIRALTRAGCIMDIVVEFPESMGVDPVSFAEVGLWNCPGGMEMIRQTGTDSVPRVTMDFYGKLVCEELDD